MVEIKETLKTPRILVISRSDYLHDKESEANTIRSYMTVFPQENVCSILCGDFNLDKIGEIDSNTYQLGHKDILGASVLIGDKRQSNTTIVPTTLSKTKRLSFSGWLKSLAINFYSLLPYKINQDLFRFISEFQPDVLYTTFTNNREMLLARRISREMNIPIVPHFFDDWPNVYFNGSAGELIFKKLFNRCLNSVLKEAPVCFCISERMCDEYKQRYGINNTIQLLNTVESKSLPNKTNNHNTFLYFGSLYLGRGETLHKLCEAISLTNSDVQICIGAPERHWKVYESILGGFPFVKYLGFLTCDELDYAIAKADVLLFVESFDDNMLDFTRLSLSTRIPELLSAGKLILAMGNRDQGSIVYLKNHDAAYVVDNDREIAERISEIIEGNDCEKILNNASCLFHDRHEKKGQQQLFYDTINSVVR